jgi:hypothetical protein
MGRIGKRVRIPCGRATVMIVAKERRCKARRPAIDALQPVERLAQGCSGRTGAEAFIKVPPIACSFFRGEQWIGGTFCSARAGATPDRLILAGVIVTTFLSSAIVFVTTLMDATRIRSCERAEMSFGVLCRKPYCLKIGRKKLF